MPLTDRREIEFDAESLLRVVGESLRAAHGLGLPALRPTDVRFCPRDGVVSFLYDASQWPQAVRMTAEALGALLVSYCIRAGIPMPRRAEKGIRIAASAVVLAFRTEGTPEKTARNAASVSSWTWIEPRK
jgi:hypothetical protein